MSASHDNESDYDITARARKVRARQDAESKERGLAVRNETGPALRKETGLVVRKRTDLATLLKNAEMVPMRWAAPGTVRAANQLTIVRTLSRPKALAKLNAGVPVKVGNKLYAIDKGERGVMVLKVRIVKGAKDEVQEPLPYTHAMVDEDAVRNMLRRNVPKSVIVSELGWKRANAAISMIEQERKEDVYDQRLVRSGKWTPPRRARRR